LSCGIELHARPLSLGGVHPDGESLGPRHMPAGPAPFLHAVAPSRTDLVVCVEDLFPWYWLADLCARASLPFVRGHARSMQAMHGGNAKNDTSDAPKIAGLLRDGMRPQASVYPAEMRATRALRRCRLPLTRPRAALLAHLQKTTRQDNLPERGKKLADKANRAGGAARVPAPAVPHRVEGDLPLIDFEAP
jgi:hypothetical protein